jgi:hypothetical protein
VAAWYAGLTLLALAFAWRDHGLDRIPGIVIIASGSACDRHQRRPGWEHAVKGTLGVRHGRLQDPAAGSPVAALEWMPLASLVLAADGSLIGVNRAWAALPRAAGAGRGDGWLHEVEPLDREGLRACLTDGKYSCDQV